MYFWLALCLRLLSLVLSELPILEELWDCLLFKKQIFTLNCILFAFSFCQDIVEDALNVWPQILYFLLAFFLLFLFPSLTSRFRACSLKPLCTLPAVVIFCVFCRAFYCSWQHLHLLARLHHCSFLSFSVSISAAQASRLRYLREFPRLPLVLGMGHLYQAIVGHRH